MRFLLGVVCVIALFGAVYAQVRCEACKAVAKALKRQHGQLNERSCDEFRGLNRDICLIFAKAGNEISSRLMSLQKMCEALSFCRPPAGPDLALDFDKIAEGAKETVKVVAGVAVEVVGGLVETAPVAVVSVGFAAGFLALLYAALPAAPLLLLGRRKRDLVSTERNMAGIYGEEEGNPFEYMDPTLDPSSDLPEATDAYMKQAASSLKCELCKLGILIDSSNTTLLQTGQDGAPMRKLLCHSLPEKGDQRKCMTVLRQASEIFLQILGSIFDSLETCEGLKSCQVG